MAKCTPELWTLKDIHESLSKGFNGNKKIVIPMFQRGKRWKPNQEALFIDSLKKNYPIGTLLFYKTTKNEQEVYTLIDGLQRSTAITRYLSNPTHFFSIKQFPDDILQEIYELAEVNDSEWDNLNNKIIKYITGLSSFEAFEIAELFSELCDTYSMMSVKLKQFTAIVKPFFQSIKDDYSNLSNSQIPAIVYSGDEETLPDIFALMNSKGTPLTDYEIYAASWPSKKMKISNNEIVEYVLKKYDCLNEGGYEVDGYNRDEIRRSKMLNSFEYVFGLSKYITDKYKILEFFKNISDDETNPIAFQLINACFNSSHKQIKDLHYNILNYHDKMDILENCLIKSIEFVDKSLNQITKFKGNKRTSRKMQHSQYQIMSLISFVFRERFDENLKEREEWNNSSKVLMNTIWKYYVYDILIKYWSDGGTTKIHTANNEKRYLNEISRGMFSIVFDNYIEQCNNIKESEKVANPNEKDFVILNTLYLNIFTAMDQLSLENFDVEHIATKNQMKNLIKQCGGTGLPISHIANTCYLPEGINRTKKHLNFYQDDTYLSKTKLIIEDIENKYSFTEEEMLEWMDLEYQSGDFDVLKEYYFEYLSKRTKILKEKFMSALGFVGEVHSENEKHESIELVSSDFTEDFFRLEKIGVVAKKAIGYLLENELISDADLKKLESSEYCRMNLGCEFPLFVTAQNEIEDSKGRKRYWISPMKYKDKELYVCSQWFEGDRKLLVPWLKERLNLNIQ